MICRNCGQEIPEGSMFCQNCGQAANENSTDIISSIVDKNIINITTNRI